MRTTNTSCTKKKLNFRKIKLQNMQKLSWKWLRNPGNSTILGEGKNQVNENLGVLGKCARKILMVLIHYNNNYLKIIKLFDRDLLGLRAEAFASNGNTKNVTH